MNWLLVAVAALLIVLNAFFVDRRVLARALAPSARWSSSRAGPPRREAGGASARATSTSTSRPARSATRWPRSGSARSARPRSRICSTILSGTSRPRGRGRDRGGRRLPDDHERPDHRRRDGAQALRDRPGRDTSRGGRRAPLQWFRVLFHPFIVMLSAASNAMLGVLGVDPDAADRARRLAR